MTKQELAMLEKVYEAEIAGAMEKRSSLFQSRNGFIRVQHTNGSFVIVDDELEAFARLIVERCAGVADSMNESDWSPAQVAAAIRKLLEAE